MRIKATKDCVIAQGFSLMAGEERIIAKDALHITKRPLFKMRVDGGDIVILSGAIKEEKALKGNE